jgi:hypothetical protein
MRLIMFCQSLTAAGEQEVNEDTGLDRFQGSR